MTIDTIIARLTFDAVTQDKDFQVKTTKAIELLARSKEIFGNDFDAFLSSFTNNIDSDIKEYNKVFNGLCNTEYALFQKVVDLQRIALCVGKNYNESTVFLSNFLQNNKGNSEIYTKAAKQYIVSQAKIADFVEESNQDLEQISYDLKDAVGYVDNKNDTVNLIVLANINRFLLDSKGKPKFLQSCLNNKLKELDICQELLLAHDITYLRDYAEKQADNMRAARMIGFSAGEYVDTVHTYMAIERGALMGKVRPKKQKTKENEIRAIIARGEEYATLKMLSNQQEYSFADKVKKAEQQRTM